MKLLRARLKILIFASSSLLALLLTTFFIIQTSGGREKIIIGAKNCTEQHILSEVLAQLIEKETNFKVVRKFNLEGTTICFNALKSNTIDLYVEYTGTAIIDILKEPIPIGSLFHYVKEVFREKYGIIWFNRLGLSNQYALIARRDSGLEWISDLEKHPGIKVAFDPEFATRLEPVLLKKQYQNTSCHQLMDQVLLYFSLANRAIDVMSGFSTDGRLADPRFIVLKDDRGVLPTYEAAPVMTQRCLNKHPILKPILEKLKGAISTEEMSQLNYRVEVEGEEIKSVVHGFLNLKEPHT